MMSEFTLGTLVLLWLVVVPVGIYLLVRSFLRRFFVNKGLVRFLSAILSMTPFVVLLTLECARESANYRPDAQADTTAIRYFADTTHHPSQLLGLTKREIVQLLGPKDTSSDKIFYNIGPFYRYYCGSIGIKFINGRATEIGKY